MMRLDHNRAIAQLAHKTGAANADIKDVVVWGNHSADQYPDVSFAKVAGKPAAELVDEEWLSSYYRPTVAKRGAAIIEARGAPRPPPLRTLRSTTCTPGSTAPLRASGSPPVSCPTARTTASPLA